MDQQPPFNPPSYQLPHSLPESGLRGILGTNNVSYEPTAHLNEPNELSDLNEFYFCSSAPAPSAWPAWMNQEIPAPEEEATSSFQTAEAPGGAFAAMQTPPESSTQPVSLQSLGNVSQWLEGAFRPPVPCSYCRKQRLQCLTIRTTPANPNPVTSCSSCVALFRECSLSRGEKRLAAGFETFTPVLGHLHGLPEHMDAANDSFVPTEGLGGLGSIEERKESKQFVRRGARTLREWFYQNQEYPYPDEHQRTQLMRETGFSQKRIATWFANARRRQKQKLQSSKMASKDIPRAGSPLIASTLDSMTPMERWKASPPEDEPISESVIQNAIATGAPGSDVGVDLFQFDEASVDFFNFDESSSHLASSVSSFGSRASETSSSVSSAWSYQSGELALPFPLLPEKSRSPRQRRQRGSHNDLYQCTFCTRSFPKRHDWARHEKSVHLALDTWVCTPNISELQEKWISSLEECHFCAAPFPDASHWDEHDFAVCAYKPVAERSFHRKDYLWQHLRKFHSCTKVPLADLSAWRGTGGNVQSRCGFCNCSLPTWAARADHLAHHFKAGLRMEQWQGDWGLDTSALSALRNAVLPAQRPMASPSLDNLNRNV